MSSSIIVDGDVYLRASDNLDDLRISVGESVTVSTGGTVHHHGHAPLTSPPASSPASMFEKLSMLFSGAAEEDTTIHCQVCLERVPVSQSVSLTACGHCFCKECVTTYLELKIRDGQVYPICFYELHTDTTATTTSTTRTKRVCGVEISASDIKGLVSATELVKYAKFKFNKENEAFARQCPHCHQSQLCPQGPQQPVCVCVACAKSFCFLHGNAHEGKPCAEYERREMKNERLTRTTIQKTSRPCPKCRRPIEKSGCGTDFCWLCGANVSTQLSTHYQWWNLSGCAGLMRIDIPQETKSQRILSKAVSLVHFAIVGPLAVALMAVLIAAACFCAPCCCLEVDVQEVVHYSIGAGDGDGAAAGDGNDTKKTPQRHHPSSTYELYRNEKEAGRNKQVLQELGLSIGRTPIIDRISGVFSSFSTPPSSKQKKRRKNLGQGVMEADPLAATALPSLLTSACVIALIWRFSAMGELPVTTFVFFTMLPTLSALACLQDARFLATCKRFFQWLFLRGHEESADIPLGAMDALTAARQELSRSFTDRWSTARRGGHFSLSRFSAAELSVQQGNGGGSAVVGGATGAARAAGNTSGKSLYDQVRAHLKDHVFIKHHDAPIYFMDPATGCFLRVNEQHKLVFTSTPDASCLFHVVKGKTHHWGFHSTIHQRYIGQNIMGKVVVNSKKMNSWEAFRVLERPQGSSGGGGAEHTIYLVLCSARFGKGMWVGKQQRRTPANPTDTYLTKNFTHALALVYASDLSAFEALTQPQQPTNVGGSIPQRQLLASNPTKTTTTNGIVGGAAAGMPTKKLSSSWISVSESDADLGDEFQVPILATAERTRVVLPWIDDMANKRFFEMPEKQMVDVVSTTISRFTVREMLEFFIDQDARRLCHEKTSQAPVPPPNSSSGTTSFALTGAMCEWHLHPHFGFVRKLTYRPPAPESSSSSESEAVSATGENKPAEPSASPMVPSIAIDQYHACSVNEMAMQKAVFRSKMYTLSIPHSNCFSVETLFEFQDTQDREGPYVTTPSHAVLTFKCKTGIYFTRKTMFAPQIEKGVLEGVKKTCDLLLQLAEEFRAKRAVPSVVTMPLAPLPPPLAVLQPQQGAATTTAEASVATMASSSSSSSLVSSSSLLDIKTPRDAFPPHTLAVEVIKGMSNALRTADTLNMPPNRVRSSLVIHMPWTPAEMTAISRPVTARAFVGGFFECAPQAFECVLDETIRGGDVVTPSLVFDVLLSDECSFFHVVHKQSGNMEVDIGAWRIARFPVSGGGGDAPLAGVAHVRKQLFSMPVSGVAGLDVAHVEDYQYYSLQKSSASSSSSSPHGERLEFGMKIFAKDLPDGDQFSIEVLVVVEKPIAGACQLRVLFAIAKPAIASSNSISSISSTVSGGGDDPLQAAVVYGAQRGLVAVWKRVAMVVAQEATRTTTDDLLRHRLQFVGQLPTHDELSSKLIEAITSVY